MLIQYAVHVSTSDISPLTIPSFYPTSAGAFHLIEMMMMMMMVVVMVVVVVVVAVVAAVVAAVVVITAPVTQSRQ